VSGNGEEKKSRRGSPLVPNRRVDSKLKGLKRKTGVKTIAKMG